MYVAATNLSISELQEQIWALLDDLTNFNEYTAYLAMLEARRLNIPLIAELMLERIRKFFQVLIASSDYLTLDVSKKTRKLFAINC